MPGVVLPWRRARGLLGPGALLPFAVVSAGVVGTLGLSSAGQATAVGAAAAGLTALVSGPVLLARWWRAGREQSFRAWIGWAVTVWGLGEMLQAWIALTGTPTFPTPGDLVSLSSAVPAVVGALKIPRRGRHGEAPDGAVRWRLPVDAALIAVTAALLVWQFAFLSIFTAGGPLRFDGDSLTAVLVLVSDVSVTAVAFLVGIRDLDRDMLLVSVGTGCYTVGDLVTIHTILGGGVWPWEGAVLWCLAWPLIAVGLVRYEPLRGRADADADADPDARVVLVTTYAALGLLALGVVLVIGSPSLQADVVSLWLVVAALGLLAGREWLNARMRARLLGRLRTEATTDPLTGLANRRELVRRLGTVRSPQDWSLLAVDLDGFKEVNAVLGHPTGDRLLQAAAARIAEVAPTGSLVSRSGGDEFAVLVPAGVAAAATVGERLVTAVHRAAAEVPGVDRVSVSASVGVAAVCGPDLADPVPAVDPDGATGDDVAAHLHVTASDGPPDPLAALSAAGAALRTAKSLGRDRVVVFDDVAARTRRRRLLVEERLRVAVSADALQVAFHPIVRLSDGQVVGAEALARWTDDVLGVVDPAEFIPVAEETGLVVALGELVLHRTLGEAVRHDLPGRGLYVGCNVSPVQLRVPGFDRLVTEALTAHGVPSSALVVEVTEAVLIEEDSPAVRTLRRLATSGITVAIDDFGTGYSALGYLRRLPAHALKVDRSLTASLAQDTRDRAIVAAVVELGRSMGLDVVVEGIETPEDADLVTALGAGFGQGALYGPAVPAAELVALAARPGDGDARGA